MEKSDTDARYRKIRSRRSPELEEIEAVVVEVRGGFWARWFRRIR